MPDAYFDAWVADVSRALERADLHGARERLAELPGLRPRLGSDEARALRASLVHWQDQAATLRARYAGELKEVLRRRHNATAYQDVGRRGLKAKA